MNITIHAAQTLRRSRELSPFTTSTEVIHYSPGHQAVDVCSGAGTIRHEGARAPPLREMARHGGHRTGVT